MTLEIIVMYAAVTLYAIGAILEAVGLVFRRDVVLKIALWPAIAGLAVHAVGIGVRWIRTGHGPYLGFYEAVSSFAWLAVLAFVLLVWRFPTLRRMGAVVMPAAFLSLGGAMLAPKTDLPITGRLASYWLSIHVSFAKLSFTSFIAAFILALAYLIRDRRRRAAAQGALAEMPDLDTLDDLSFRLIGVGFIFLTMMIAAGAIWANEAWGRYWAWDPIETWSLIAWIVYVGYLHLRLTMGWRGRRAAWYALLALPVMLFALVGVPLVYKSIHAAYLTGIGQ